MKLSELLASVPSSRLVSGSADVSVGGVQHDSRRVGLGDLFVAVPGTKRDGCEFVTSAVAAGAAAVVAERGIAAHLDVPVAVVPDARQAVAVFAHLLAGEPTRSLAVCGITGTNGKTTTTFLGRSILEHAGKQVAVLGTIEYVYGNRRIRAPMTTPDAIDLAGYFADMVQTGIDYCLMEVSSHALDQWRVHGIDFRVAAFTNLTAEHLDYHGDMVSYREAKGRLFEFLVPSACAVLNADDEVSRTFAEGTKAQVLWYGLDNPADVAGGDLSMSLEGSRFRLLTPRGEADVHTPLVGRHNVYNCLAAAAIAEALGVDVEVMAEGISAVRTIRGRLEPVATSGAEGPFTVLVDYAHTDDALANALSAVKPLVKRRLILVFGCGGDRDRLKRPRMGAVAEEFADVIFVTSDNPRSEKPEAIAEEIMSGFKNRARASVVLDRREAITAALRDAGRGDIVVIAGKGHETYQEIAGVSRPFDDREVAREVLRHLQS